MHAPTADLVSRRQLLNALGVASGLAVLNHAVAQENNPAAQVADSASSIRITAMKTHRVQHKVYLEFSTSAKITGWGEVSALVPTAAEELCKSLFELLDGENPTRIEHLWQKLYRAHRDMRGGPFMCHTLAGIDMALWDITGKLWGVPVHRLLGGPCRDKIRVYPTSKAHKVPPHGIYGHSGNPNEIERMVNAIKQTRERVGPDGTVMFDAHCAVPPATLIQLAAAVKAYDVLFFEEVAVPGNIEVFKRLKEQISIPMATGERDHTIWEFIPYLHERCIDILQPDCAHTGGITQMKKIATLAEAFFVPLAPHCTCSELGLSASIHAAFAIPFLLIHEGYLDGHLMPAGVARKSWDQDKDGYATLPQGPGLGVTVDESMFEKVNADPKRVFKWPKPTLPDGAVRDY